MMIKTEVDAWQVLAITRGVLLRWFRDKAIPPTSRDFDNLEQAKDFLRDQCNYHNP